MFGTRSGNRIRVVLPGNRTVSDWTNSTLKLTSSRNQGGRGCLERLRFLTAPVVPMPRVGRFGLAHRRPHSGSRNSNPWNLGSRGLRRTSPWFHPATNPWDRLHLMSVGAEYQKVDVRP
jgi:hypothetical protein